MHESQQPTSSIGFLFWNFRHRRRCGTTGVNWAGLPEGAEALGGAKGLLLAPWHQGHVGLSIVMGLPLKWLVYFRENLGKSIYKWMMKRGSPICGNPHKWGSERGFGHSSSSRVNKMVQWELVRRCESDSAGPPCSMFSPLCWGRSSSYKLICGCNQCWLYRGG